MVLTTPSYRSANAPTARGRSIGRRPNLLSRKLQDLASAHGAFPKGGGNPLPHTYLHIVTPTDCIEPQDHPYLFISE
jgi:hypothetical protein